MWGGIGSRHPVHLRKWLWPQKEPEPFINLMERATGIEPASQAWEARVITIIRRPQIVLPIIAQPKIDELNP